MKNLVIVLVVAIIGALAFVYINSQRNVTSQVPQPSGMQTQVSNDETAVKVIAQGLDTPWGIAFLPASPAGGPDKSMLVTERVGRVRLIDQSGNLQSEPVATISQVREIGEGGLLGITLHPDFSNNNYVYLYYTYSSVGDNTLNRVVRMKYQNRKLIDEETIVDKIPGAIFHNGGRIKFGPDGYLYVTTGDARNPSLSQDLKSLAGEILSVTGEGNPTPGNPVSPAFAQHQGFNRLIFSWGHRNPQGIAWDSDGNLWAAEHGDTNHDEINKIGIGRNYGWPTIRGDQQKEGLETPIVNSGNNTWAPAGIAYHNGSLFFGGLRGQALFEYNIQDNNLKEHFKGEFGRIREVITGPDGMLYISTSNQDGRGNPQTGDDKIIRINPQKL